MKAVLTALTAGGFALGLFRPGIMLALALQSYNLKEYFGSTAIGNALNLAFPALGVLYLIRNKIFKFHIIDLYFILFYLYYVISVIRSQELSGSFITLMTFTILGPGYYFASRMMILDNKDVSQIAKDFMWSMLLLSVLAGLVSEANLWGTRTSIGEATAVGTSVAFNVALCAGLYYLTGRKDDRILPVKYFDSLFVMAALIMIFNATLENGTRGALIGPLFGILFFAALYVLAHAERSLRLVMIAAGVAFVLSLPIIMAVFADFLVSLPPDAIPGRHKASLLNLSSTFTGDIRYKAFDPSSYARLETYRQAWIMISEAPIFGHGIGASAIRIGEYPHNLFLELWVEMGAVGILLFVAFAGPAFLIGLRNAIFGPMLVYNRVFFGIALGLFLQMQVSLSFTFAKALFVGLGALVTWEVIRSQRQQQTYADVLMPAPTLANGPRAADRK